MCIVVAHVAESNQVFLVVGASILVMFDVMQFDVLSLSVLLSSIDGPTALQAHMAVPIKHGVIDSRWDVPIMRGRLFEGLQHVPTHGQMWLARESSGHAPAPFGSQFAHASHLLTA